MTKKPLFVNPAILATKEKLKDRFLFVGKFFNVENPSLFVFYVIEILSPWFPSTKVEKTISSVLKDCFVGNPDFNFEDTLRLINQKLSDLARQGDSDWVGNLNATIGLVVGDQLHLTMSGSLLGYLIRRGKVVSITEGLDAKDEINPAKSFQNITTGLIADNDRIIIANVNFFDFMSVERLRSTLIDKTAKISMQEIHKLLRRSRAREVSAILLEISHFINPDSTNDLPEVFYIERSADTWFHKFIKTATPYAKSAAYHTKNISKKTYQKTKEGTKKAKESWNTKYQPKVKELITSTSQKTRENIASVSKKDYQSAPQKPSGIKVNSYTKKTSKWLSLFYRYISALFKFIKPIFFKKNRRYLYVLLIAIFIMAGYLKVRSNNADRKLIDQKQQSEISLNQASDLYNQGKEDMALEREGGKDKLVEALNLVNGILDHPTTHDQAYNLRKDILESLDELTKTVRFWNLSSSFQINGEVVASVLVGSSIYSVTDEGKIYLTDTRDQNPSLIASIGQDNGSVVDLAFSSSLDAVMIYTDNNSVWSLSITTEVIEAQNISDNAGNWETAKALSSYTSNLYLLDSDAGQVWKHIKTADGFLKGSSYLNTSAVSIRGSVDLAIDGNIYVLHNKGNVIKFVRGAHDVDFKLGEIPSPGEQLKGPDEIFTDQDTNFIYILDNIENRVIRFEKNGQFSSQFAFEGISISQFFVNPRVQKMWVESDNNFYEINL